jgi:hypothetical protein
MPDVTITVGEDGPYMVDGDIRLTDPDGRELDLPYDVELCRCARSANQPFVLRRRACDQLRTARQRSITRVCGCTRAVLARRRRAVR